jgi:cytochrome c553
VEIRPQKPHLPLQPKDKGLLLPVADLNRRKVDSRSQNEQLSTLLRQPNALIIHNSNGKPDSDVRLDSLLRAILLPVLLAGTVARSQNDVPKWPFPGAGTEKALPHPGPAAPTALAPAASGTLVSVPGSALRISRSGTVDPYSPPDWFPGDHPSMPGIVGHGRSGKLFACGYCHLPDGSGRPENANITGLPAAYIGQQIAAFADGRRHNACVPDTHPMELMRAEAGALRPEEVAAAAANFSAIPRKSKVRIVEVSIIPAPRQQAFIYAFEPEATDEPIGARIIEVATEMEGHERRDPRMNYIAYVPPGSIARGSRLAKAGPDGPATSCFICHGADLRGTPAAPPLAGQFPTVILRQLIAFQTGRRSGPETTLMRPVVARLSVDDMIALATFAASRPP